MSSTCCRSRSQTLRVLDLWFSFHVGAMVGAIASGQIAEYIGRKGSLMIASIPNILGWLAISFAKDTSFLYMGRLLEGFGVGVISYTVPVYIAEISPQNLRGALGSVNQLSVTIGILLAYVLGIFIPWRLLAIIGKDGMTEDFEASFQVLRGFDTDISAEVNEIKAMLLFSEFDLYFRRFAEVSGNIDQKDSNPIFTTKTKEILTSSYGELIGIGLLVLQQLSGINGILFYASNIFKAAGLTNGNLATSGLGAIQVVATLFTTWLLDRAGRRALLIISTIAMTLSLLLVSAAFFLEGAFSEGSHLYHVMSILSLVGLVAYVVGFSLGVGAIPWIIMSEILPVNIKSLAGSVATLATGTFTIYTIVSALTLLFVFIWVPETKGRTLEEIQWSFR